MRTLRSRSRLSELLTPECIKSFISQFGPSFLVLSSLLVYLLPLWIHTWLFLFCPLQSLLSTSSHPFLFNSSISNSHPYASLSLAILLLSSLSLIILSYLDSLPAYSKCDIMQARSEPRGLMQEMDSRNPSEVLSDEKTEIEDSEDTSAQERKQEPDSENVENPKADGQGSQKIGVRSSKGSDLHSPISAPAKTVSLL